MHIYLIAQTNTYFVDSNGKAQMRWPSMNEALFLFPESHCSNTDNSVLSTTGAPLSEQHCSSVELALSTEKR